MTSTAIAAGRFVRRTSLGDDEYRVNFKQIDCEVLDALASDEACAVTPSMSKIYIRLIRSPLSHWEREGVLRFVGEGREDKTLTAWDQLLELTGVANSTLSKALAWMHEAGVIGYDARKNGVGIRIFINRARSSIRSKSGEKNLRLVPTPSVTNLAPSDGMPFKEGICRNILEKDINPRAAGARVSNELSAAANTERPAVILAALGTEDLSSQGSLGQIVKMVRRELEPVIASSCNKAITSACHKEAALNREWLERAGIPKAIRVAQHEAFNALRSHGIITKQNSHSGNVGRHCASSEEGREGNNEKIRIAAFLAEARDALVLAAANAPASEQSALRIAFGTTERELDDLRDRFVADDKDLPFDFVEVENRLLAAKDRLTKAIWQSNDPGEIESMLKSARTELQRYEATMEPNVFKDTLRRHVAARLYEQHGLPHLSLLYL